MMMIMMINDEDEESHESEGGEVCTTCVLPSHSAMVAAIYCIRSDDGYEDDDDDNDGDGDDDNDV